MKYEEKSNVRNVQVSLVVAPPTPKLCHPEHSHPQDVQFDNRFPQSRSIPDTHHVTMFH